eukprot:2368061-Rhodomonas_salina.1
MVEFIIKRRAGFMVKRRHRRPADGRAHHQATLDVRAHGSGVTDRVVQALWQALDVVIELHLQAAYANAARSVPPAQGAARSGSKSR